MAIVHMASKQSEIPEGARNPKNVSEQWKGCSADPANYELWTYETHNGLCLLEREQNGYNDSDFFMVVWNAEEKKPETVEFASTRGWCYPCLGSYVDATPEVQAAYAEWTAERNARFAKERAEAEARRPAKGKTIKVIAGRKIPKGTLGVVFWTGNDKFARRNYVPSVRLGVQLEDGTKVFTSSNNVEVVV